MSLPQENIQQVKEIAELEVRRYFDHYQTEVFPGQLRTIIEAHDADDKAHGSVEARVNRVVWIGLGIAVASGASGALAAKALATALFG